MSDEQRTEEEVEVEAHKQKVMQNLEPSDEGENDFEAHRLRHDKPKND
jgi:hypothetical protein